MSTDNSVETFSVRDRRKPKQYSLDNLVMDEWFPIIGPTGYGIYSLYVRLANREDERAYPGYSLILDHLGISSATLSFYNELLILCGLIHKVQGGPDSSNDYFILEPPNVTNEFAQTLYDKMQEDTRSMAKAIVRRLENWQPLTDRFWQKGTLPSKGGVLYLVKQGTLPSKVGVLYLVKQGTLPSKEEQSLYNNPYINNPNITTDSAPNGVEIEEKTVQAPNGEIELDKGFAQTVKAYEANIGMISKTIADNLAAALEELEPDEVVEAIEIAAKKKNKSWNYINGILKNKTNGKEGAKKTAAANAAWDKILQCWRKMGMDRYKDWPLTDEERQALVRTAKLFGGMSNLNNHTVEFSETVLRSRFIGEFNE